MQEKFVRSLSHSVLVLSSLSFQGLPSDLPLLHPLARPDGVAEPPPETPPAGALTSRSQMAPRGRSRKSLAGLKRIDAAIQHEAPLGFSETTVRSTVRKFLEAYEGEQGWYFIEENSYRLLFETILDDQKEEQSKKVADVVVNLVEAEEVLK